MTHIGNLPCVRPQSFTKHVCVETGMYTFDGYVQPEADFDGTFRLWDEDTNELLGIHGWLVSDITFYED